MGGGGLGLVGTSVYLPSTFLQNFTSLMQSENILPYVLYN